MNERTHKVIFFLLATTCFLFARAERVTAQQTADGQVSIKLERGGSVAVDNRTTGRITVIGWDKDTVEATATSERGIEAVRVSFKETAVIKSIWLKADYLKRAEDEKPRPEPPPAVTTSTDPLEIPPLPKVLPGQIRLPGDSKYEGPIDPPMRDGQPIEVHLEVRVPRYAQINLIRVIRSPVLVTNVENPIIVLGEKSDIVLRNVRDAEVRTRSGAVEIEDAAGFVEVVTTSGAVRVRRAQADVRVLSISGDIDLECVRGRVNIDSADGSITLTNIQGDVEANASNSNVLFTGAIREDGRYHLKTMSGTVEMAVRDKPPGFTASLSSYRGTIENDFQLQLKQSGEQHQEGDINRRIIGRHGNGQAQITLDSFDGRVKLGKLSPGAMKECKLESSK
jgi:Putative adhesin